MITDNNQKAQTHEINREPNFPINFHFFLEIQEPHQGSWFKDLEYKCDEISYNAALTFFATLAGTQFSQILELERKFLAVSSMSPPDSSM